MSKPLPKFFLPVLLTVLIVAGIFGAQIALRDPQEHAHGKFGKLLFRPVEAYDFQLTDHHGRPVRLSQFRGQAVVFAFGFTNCPNICPATLAHFANIRKALPPGVRDKVQFLFIGVDPERDTPEKLGEYVPFFDPAFLGLTGSPTALQGTAYKYKASFAKNPPRGDDPADYFVDHTADTYLISPEGKWVMSWPLEELAKTGEVAREIARVAGRGP